MPLSVNKSIVGQGGLPYIPRACKWINYNLYFLLVGQDMTDNT